MRKLKDFAEQSDAQALSDHLETQGMENEVREAAQGFAVWVIHHDALAEAQEKLSRFEVGAQSGAAVAAKKIRKERREAARPVMTRFRSSQSARSAAGPLGAGILFLFVGTGLVALLSGLGRTWIPALGIVPFDPETGLMGPLDFREPWRLVTPIFMHFGFFHLIFNMMWMHRLGTQIEAVHGTARLVALVVLSAVLGNLGQLYWGGHPYFGGMSGVNYALFGFVWMQARYGPARQYSLSSGDVWLLMIWLILCGTGLVGAVANAAHAMGLVVGIVAGLPVYVRFRRVYNLKGAAQPQWGAKNSKGWQRFDRLYVQPYAPAWFLAAAVFVLIIS